MSNQTACLFKQFSILLLVLLGNKQVAKCLICLKVLSNTSMSRLIMHRKICNTNKFSNTSDESKEDNLEPVLMEMEPSISSSVNSLSHLSSVSSVSNITNNQENSIQNKRKRLNIINVNSDNDDDVSEGSKSTKSLNILYPSSPLSDIIESTRSTDSFCLGTQPEVGLTSVSLCPKPNHRITVKSANKQDNMYKYHDKISSVEIESVNYKLAKLFLDVIFHFRLLNQNTSKNFVKHYGLLINRHQEKFYLHVY